MILLGSVFIPFSVKADEKKYTTLNLQEALKEEEIAEEFTNYKPDKDAITVYLFRGNGCGYCRAFLTFLNSIADEYGKYFVLESYEVWNNQENASLMTEVSEYLDNPASGVPYIIIGDKVFAGYAAEYDDGIKTAITDLYNTKKSKRYDVFEEMKKHPKKSTESNNTNSNSMLIWMFAMVFVATGIIISFISIKFKELNIRLDELTTKKETKTSKKK